MCFDAEKLEKQLIKQPNPGNAFRHLLYIYGAAISVVFYKCF